MIFLISIVASFMVTFILLPVIIKVATSIDLLDIPDRRKIHYVGIPSLGGVAIFFGMMMAIVITVSIVDLATYKYLLTGICLIFILGIRDDVSSLLAKHKLAVQIFAAIMVVFFSDIKLSGLYNIAGIGSLPYGLDYALSVFVIVAMTNSFNLIDGIDGLAGTLGIIILSFFAWTFLVAGQPALAVISISGVGALFAFLYYNWYPSKVFMGDTGSMILGFMISSLAISAINAADGLVVNSMLTINASVALIVACLIIPIYDTSRVFLIRFSQGRSPLSPDRNHIHHQLLKAGFNHAQATVTLASINIFFIGVALFLNQLLTNGQIILTLMIFVSTFGGIVDFVAARKGTLGKSAKIAAKKIMEINKSA